MLTPSAAARQSSSLHLLRRALQLDGVFCMVGGIGLLLAGNPIARFLGVENAGFLAMLGGVVMVYALLLLRGTARPSSIRALGLTVALLNTAWVIGSVALLLGGWLPLTTGGKWAVAIVAAIVATFALVQFYALRHVAR